MRKYVITAAGGNATAIGVISKAKERSWYEENGRALMEHFKRLDVEQVGFLITSENHFEMSGGELCGNGTRAAGLLLAKLRGVSKHWTFTTSGHEGTVRVEIENISTKTPFVTGAFPNMKAEARPVTLLGVDKTEIVDLGGIVHVIIYADMPNDYQAEHQRVCEELCLKNRAAVGVNWIAKQRDQVLIHPVVWVKAIDTYFYETSCGSGSIATAIATNISDIVQPSGQTIIVANRGGVLTIASNLEVVHGP